MFTIEAYDTEREALQRAQALHIPRTRCHIITLPERPRTYGAGRFWIIWTD